MYWFRCSKEHLLQVSPQKPLWQLTALKALPSQEKLPFVKKRKWCTLEKDREEWPHCSLEVNAAWLYLPKSLRMVWFCSYYDINNPKRFLLLPNLLFFAFGNVTHKSCNFTSQKKQLQTKTDKLSDVFQGWAGVCYLCEEITVCLLLNDLLNAEENV